MLPIVFQGSKQTHVLKAKILVQINLETIEESSIKKLLTPVSFTDWTIARKGVGYTNDDVQVCFAEKQHLCILSLLFLNKKCFAKSSKSHNNFNRISF